MKLVISPAKTLDYETELPTSRGTQPQFLETTETINKTLTELSRKEIAQLMKISDKLADLNHERYQKFNKEHNKKNSRSAVYAFAGDVYTGLDAYSIPVEKLDFLQESLRILSGFYGILRPLDLIQPYRLEMGTPVSVGDHKNLYELWQKQVTSSLNKDMKKNELLINLASKEYFKAINTADLKAPVVSPVFKDFKNGKMKVIAFYAKKARGAMVRFIVDHEVRTLEELKAFDYGGYRYCAEETTDEKELVFTR